MEVVLLCGECKVLRSACEREIRGYFFEAVLTRRAQSAIPSERQRNPRSATNPIITKAIIATTQLEDNGSKAREVPKEGER